VSPDVNISAGLGGSASIGQKSPLFHFCTCRINGFDCILLAFRTSGVMWPIHPQRKEIFMKKVALIALFLLCLAPLAQAVCNLDIIDEGVPPFTVGVFSSFTGSLPAGVTMTAGGTISGTATTAKTNNIVCIRIQDAAGCHVTKCFYIEAE
jgi:hypothetical protein